MRIGELAARSGVSVRALRYYEEQGLLAPRRTPAGQRVYDPQHEQVVRRIQELLAAGFCSSVMRELLPALSNPGAAGDRLRDAFAAARARLESERQAVETELSALERLQQQLGLAPDVHVRADGGAHERTPPTTTAPPDHRDRRLR